MAGAASSLVRAVVPPVDLCLTVLASILESAWRLIALFLWLPFAVTMRLVRAMLCSAVSLYVWLFSSCTYVSCGATDCCNVQRYTEEEAARLGCTRPRRVRKLKVERDERTRAPASPASPRGSSQPVRGCPCCCCYCFRCNPCWCFGLCRFGPSGYGPAVAVPEDSDSEATDGRFNRGSSLVSVATRGHQDDQEGRLIESSPSSGSDGTSLRRVVTGSSASLSSLADRSSGTMADVHNGPQVQPQRTPAGAITAVRTFLCFRWRPMLVNGREICSLLSSFALRCVRNPSATMSALRPTIVKETRAWLTAVKERSRIWIKGGCAVPLPEGETPGPSSVTSSRLRSGPLGLLIRILQSLPYLKPFIGLCRSLKHDISDSLKVAWLAGKDAITRASNWREIFKPDTTGITRTRQYQLVEAERKRARNIFLVKSALSIFSLWYLTTNVFPHLGFFLGVPYSIPLWYKGAKCSNFVGLRETYYSPYVGKNTLSSSLSSAWGSGGASQQQLQSQQMDENEPIVAIPASKKADSGAPSSWRLQNPASYLAMANGGGSNTASKLALFELPLKRGVKLRLKRSAFDPLEEEEELEDPVPCEAPGSDSKDAAPKLSSDIQGPKKVFMTTFGPAIASDSHSAARYPTLFAHTHGSKADGHPS
jgi:hypothetical protein